MKLTATTYLPTSQKKIHRGRSSTKQISSRLSDSRESRCCTKTTVLPFSAGLNSETWIFLSRYSVFHSTNPKPDGGLLALIHCVLAVEAGSAGLLWSAG